MANKDNYHFHKDCAYYPESTERIVKEGKSKRIEFFCPAYNNGRPTLYYLGDLHTIKWACPCFEPYQQTLSDYMRGD